jgi:DNA replication protein DnaC
MSENTEPVAIGTVVQGFMKVPEVQAAMKRIEARGLRPEPSSSDETPEEAAERRCVAARNRRARWERRLPRKWATASLGDLDEGQNPRGRVSQWWESGHLNLLLQSPVAGVGKTHAAYAVGRHAVDEGATVEAWPVIELLSAMRPEGDSSALPNAVAADLLILDDIGRESDSEWTRQQLHQILDARLVNGRRTVITTNLTYDAMVARYTDPLVDRLCDDAVIVKVEGSSRRKPAPLW